MSKKSVAPKAPTAQEFPLADVTITWKHKGDHEAGQGHDVTITGARLGCVLRWMNYAHHPAMAKEPGSAIFDDVLAARLDLSALAQLQHALSQADLSEVSEPEAIFGLLSRITDDAAAVLAIHEDVPYSMPTTITIGRPAAKKAEAA